MNDITSKDTEKVIRGEVDIEKLVLLERSMFEPWSELTDGTDGHDEVERDWL